MLLPFTFTPINSWKLAGPTRELWQDIIHRTQLEITAAAVTTRATTANAGQQTQ